MGNIQSDASSSGSAVYIKPSFVSMQEVWVEDALRHLISRLRDICGTSQFTLDRMRFAKLMQIATTQSANTLADWYTHFTQGRVEDDVDGLEFFASAIILTDMVSVSTKISLLFDLFDLQRQQFLTKDSFALFLRACAGGLFRTLENYEPPPSLSILSTQAIEAINGFGNNGCLDERNFRDYLTQSDFGKYYISFLSRLKPLPFAFGSNRSGQLGLGNDTIHQHIPVPVLNLEGVQIESITTSNVNTLMIVEQGQAVLSCGSGVCGLLGVNSLQPSCHPVMIDNSSWSAPEYEPGALPPPVDMNTVRIVSVACGARHCAAVTNTGHVFCWGNGDFGQLGVDLSTNTIHTGEDPRTGLPYQYAAKPVLVEALAKSAVIGVSVGCTRFSTVVQDDTGSLYSWGNNTDGECGIPLRDAQHTVVYVDPNIHRTQLQVLLQPHKIEGFEQNKRITEFTCGACHVLAVDNYNRIYSWGYGMNGRLGDREQRTRYTPLMIPGLKGLICKNGQAGDVHSLVSLALFRLTVSMPGADITNPENPNQPFAMSVLPVGSTQQFRTAGKIVKPAGCGDIEIEKCLATGSICELSAPIDHSIDWNIDDIEGGSLHRAIMLFERPLSVGTWFVLSGFRRDMKMAWLGDGTLEDGKMSIEGSVFMPEKNSEYEKKDCDGKICIVQNLKEATPENSVKEIAAMVSDLAFEVMTANATSTVLLIPDCFDIHAVSKAVPASEVESLESCPCALISESDGEAVREYIKQCQKKRWEDDMAPEELKGWIKCVDEYNKETTWTNNSNEDDEAETRKFAPWVDPQCTAYLANVEHDAFQDRLLQLIEETPRGIIVAQRDSQPGIEFLDFEKPRHPADDPDDPEEEVNLPVGIVSFAEAEKLRSMMTPKIRPIGSYELPGPWEQGAPKPEKSYHESHLTGEPTRRTEPEEGEDGVEKVNPAPQIPFWCHGIGVQFTPHNNISWGLLSWGCASDGQLGISQESLKLEVNTNHLTGVDTKFSSTPMYIESLHGQCIEMTACGATHSMAATANGCVYLWGRMANPAARAGAGLGETDNIYYQPTQVANLGRIDNIHGLYSGAGQAFVIASVPAPTLERPDNEKRPHWTTQFVIPPDEDQEAVDISMSEPTPEEEQDPSLLKTFDPYTI